MEIVELGYGGKLRSKWVEYSGRGYNLVEKIKLRGIGSPRLIYYGGLSRFDVVSNRSNDTNYVNIELFRAGLALRLKKEDLFVCALIPKADLQEVDFETFKIKIYYNGKEIVKSAARISLLLESHKIDLLLGAAYYKPGLAFFKKTFFENSISFRIDPSPPMDENGFDAGIFELFI